MVRGVLLKLLALVILSRCTFASRKEILIKFMRAVKDDAYFFVRTRSVRHAKHSSNARHTLGLDSTESTTLPSTGLETSFLRHSRLIILEKLMATPPPPQ